MECKFTVGQKVVCVDNEARRYGWLRGQPVVGQVYEIRAIGLDHESDLVVWLKGITRMHLGHDWGYYPDRFRPVKTTQTDISIFTEIVRREFDVDKVVKKVSA